MLVVVSACRAAAAAKPRQILLGSGQGMGNHRGSRVGDLPDARGGGMWAGTQSMCSPTDGPRGWRKMAFQHGGVKIRGARPSLSTSPKIRLASITQHLLPSGRQSLLRTARRRGAVEQLVGQGLLTRGLVASLRGGGDAAETGEKAVADLEARFGSFAKEIEECEDGGRGWKDLQSRMRDAAGEMIKMCKMRVTEPHVQQRGAMIVFEGLDKSGKSTQVIASSKPSHDSRTSDSSARSKELVRFYRLRLFPSTTGERARREARCPSSRKLSDREISRQDDSARQANRYVPEGQACPRTYPHNLQLHTD